MKVFTRIRLVSLMSLQTWRKTCALLGVLYVFLILTHSALSQRRDLVVMKNGDQLTGKVKKLVHGQLYIETVYAVDPIPVDWLQVERLESTAQFQVEMSDGRRIAGTIQKSMPSKDSKGNFRIQNAAGETFETAANVVDIQSQKSNVWRQLKGSVGLGYSYASGSTETSLNIDAETSYTSTRFKVGGSLNSTITGRSDTGRTNRQDIATSSSIFLSRHAFVGNLADFLTSDQQSITLRQTYGVGYGRYFIRTNNTQLSWLGGVVYVKEAYNPDAGQNPNDQNVEALLQLNYDWFRFNASELQTNLQVFPGLSDTGRIRSSLNTSYLVRFTHDFDLRINLWDTFDNRPPVNARTNEFGISTSVGVTF
jgi:putative salt-induced outer membrane protein YdiY